MRLNLPTTKSAGMWALGLVPGSCARTPSKPWEEVASCLRATSCSMPAGKRCASRHNAHGMNIMQSCPILRASPSGRVFAPYCRLTVQAHLSELYCTSATPAEVERSHVENFGHCTALATRQRASAEEAAMRFAILGAGALGSIIAGHLARASEDVWVIARGHRAQYLRQHGITITGVARLRPIRKEALEVIQGFFERLPRGRGDQERRHRGDDGEGEIGGSVGETPCMEDRECQGRHKRCRR